MAFRCKIFVIEDDSATREMLVGLLKEAADYDVLSADNGTDAELLANSHCPDVSEPTIDTTEPEIPVESEEPRPDPEPDPEPEPEPEPEPAHTTPAHTEPTQPVEPDPGISVD